MAWLCLSETEVLLPLGGRRPCGVHSLESAALGWVSAMGSGPEPSSEQGGHGPQPPRPYSVEEETDK